MPGTGGITDEVAIESHDLIHDAELEEQKVCQATPEDSHETC